MYTEKAQTHARVVYLDMSSAFNTLQPNLLFKNISDFKRAPELALKVLAFLVWEVRNSFMWLTPFLVWTLFPQVHTKDVSYDSYLICSSYCIQMIIRAPVPICVFVLNQSFTHFVV